MCLHTASFYMLNVINVVHTFFSNGILLVRKYREIKLLCDEMF